MEGQAARRRQACRDFNRAPRGRPAVSRIGYPSRYCARQGFARRPGISRRTSRALRAMVQRSSCATTFDDAETMAVNYGLEHFLTSNRKHTTGVLLAVVGILCLAIISLRVNRRVPLGGQVLKKILDPLVARRWLIRFWFGHDRKLARML